MEVDLRGGAEKILKKEKEMEERWEQLRKTAESKEKGGVHGIQEGREKDRVDGKTKTNSTEK